jgi:hypothetical protein
MTRQRLTYTTEIAQRILDELRRGRSLRAVCGDAGTPPHGTVRQWVSDDREGFGGRTDFLPPTHGASGDSNGQRVGNPMPVTVRRTPSRQWLAASMVGAGS